MAHHQRKIVTITVVLMLAVLPLIGTDFFIDFVMTRTLMLGMAAATVTFLSAYGGMTSLAQWLVFGVAGFTVGNVVADSGRGLKLGWDPLVGVPIALLVCTVLAFGLGLLSSRSTGIYFLMLTLTFSVIG